MYKMDDLIYLMERLRHPKHGCPWDLKQDYHTIISHTLEEAYVLRHVVLPYTILVHTFGQDSD